MKNCKGILYAIISSATFGLIPLFSIPLLNEGLSDPSILFYRFGIAALVMLVLGLVTKRNFQITGREALIFIGLGVLYALTALGLLHSYNYIPSGVATTVHFLYPLVVTLLMTLIFREKSSWWLLGAAFLSLVGVFLLSWSGGESKSIIIGITTVLVTVVTYAVYIVCVNRSAVRRLDSVVLAYYVLLSGSVAFLLFALCTTGIQPITSLPMLKNVVLLALISTVLSNLTLVLAVKNIGSTMTSVLGSMEPLAAVSVGVFHFGESFSMKSAIGLTVIVVSVIIVILQDRPETRRCN